MPRSEFHKVRMLCTKCCDSDVVDDDVDSGRVDDERILMKPRSKFKTTFGGKWTLWRMFSDNLFLDWCITHSLLFCFDLIERVPLSVHDPSCRCCWHSGSFFYLLVGTFDGEHYLSLLIVLNATSFPLGEVRVWTIVKRDTILVRLLLEEESEQIEHVWSKVKVTV